MKKLTIIITLAILFFSCSNDFLKEEPYSLLSPDNFYNNDQEANAATLGVYNGLFVHEGLFQRYLGPSTESASDLFLANPTASLSGREISDYVFNSQSASISQIWSDAYICINRANSVIDNLSRDVPVSASAKTQYTGEAKFIRALVYYYLVQLFGDVPLTTTEIKSLDNANIPRTPADKVWSQIITDLNDAVSSLPKKSVYQGNDKARASKGAAKMLLAKVYMVNGQWQSALSNINEVIESKEYGLQPDIKTVFQVAYENGLESIFEAPYLQGNNPKLGSSFFKYYVPSKLFSGWTTFFVNEKFITQTQFDPSSVRFKFYFNEKGTYTNPVTGVVTNMGYKDNYFLYKFYDVFRPKGIVKASMNDDEFNFRIFRYADLLLMKAECENEINGPNTAGLDAYNLVRVRAGENTMTLVNALVVGKDSLREIIFNERGMELYGEGHRWFDLKRRGINYMLQKVTAAKSINVNEYQLLWPLPDDQIRIGNILTQNPGWE